VAGAAAFLSRRGRALCGQRLQASPQRRLGLWPDQAVHGLAVPTEHDEGRPGPHREPPIDLTEALGLVVGVDDDDLDGRVEVLLDVVDHRDHAETLDASPIEEDQEHGAASGESGFDGGRVVSRHRVEGGGELRILLQQLALRGRGGVRVMSARRPCIRSRCCSTDDHGRHD